MDVYLKKSISDKIVEELLEYIRTKKLLIGDPLPSERKLMSDFGVSRLACREALAKLQGMGILKAHHGKGVFLADINSLSVNPAVLRLLQVYGNISNSNVLEARLIIEPPAAALAARRADPDERDAILKGVQDIEQDLIDLPLLERVQSFAEVDLAFHQAVASASGNPVLPMLLKDMHELMLRVRLEVLILKPNITQRALADHRKIATAIAAGDADGAEEAMKRHIRLRGKELLQDESGYKES